MASTSETGHAQNVANLEKLIAYCTGYGAKYNPVNTSLQLSSLNALLASARKVLQDYKASKSAYNNATNVREAVFKQLKPIATKIVNAMSVSGGLPQNVDDARSTNLKIQGRRAKAVKKPVATTTEGATEVAEIKRASVSQQSYNKLVDNFEHLIHTVTTELKYAPNEDDLKLSSLNRLLDDLKAKNTDVVNAVSGFSNVRIDRNNIFYKTSTGLCDICRDVKNYVKSVFGAKSPQYKQVSEIKFMKIK